MTIRKYIIQENIKREIRILSCSHPYNLFFVKTNLTFVPYVGAGAAISTTGDSTVGFLLTGGVNVPLSPEFTATAGLNVGFLAQTDVGLMFGIGYNF